MHDTDKLAEQAKKLAASLMPTNTPQDQTPGSKDGLSGIVSDLGEKLSKGSATFQYLEKDGTVAEVASFTKGLVEFVADLKSGNYLGALMDVQQVVKGAQELWKVAGALEKAIEQDFEGIKTAYNDMSGKVGEITDKIKEDVGKIGADASDASKNIMEATQEAWGTTKDLISDVGKGINDRNFGEIAQSFEKFSDTIQNGKIQHDISKAISDGKDAAGIVTDDIHKGEDLINKAKKAMNGSGLTSGDQSKTDGTTKTSEQIASDLKGSGLTSGDQQQTGGTNKTPEQLGSDLKSSGVSDGVKMDANKISDDHNIIGGTKPQEVGGPSK